MARWYVVHTKSAMEDKVKKRITENFNESGQGDKIKNVLIPTEVIYTIKKSKKIDRTRKYFPGYIIVEMDLDDESFWLMKNIQGVSGFLGGFKPIPLSEDEVKAIQTNCEEKHEKAKPAVLYDLGENVRIIDGPFTNFIGIVDSINEERGKLKVMVTIFGRQTPVEVDFLQVEKT